MGDNAGEFDLALMLRDALEPVEIRQSRFGGVSYSYETTLDQTISAQKAEAQAAADDAQPGQWQLRQRRLQQLQVPQTPTSLRHRQCGDRYPRGHRGERALEADFLFDRFLEAAG
jgi:hypothetical protein